MGVIIIGVAMILLGAIWALFTKNSKAASFALWILYVGLWVGMVGVCVMIITSVRKRICQEPESAQPVPVEYPASEYRLQLRIVESEGQRDTTYVLVKKINKAN